MTALDYILVGSLVLAGAAAVLLFAWAFVYQGRRRYSAKRRGQGHEQ